MQTRSPPIEDVPGGPHASGRSELRSTDRGATGLIALCVALGGAAVARDGLASPAAPPEPSRQAPPPTPLFRLGEHLAASFLGTSALYHLGAAGTTALLVTQGIDHEVHVDLGRREVLSDIGLPAIVLGSVGPLAAIGVLYAVGARTHDIEHSTAAYAALQAAGITLTYVTVLKLITGRPPPEDALVGELAPSRRALSRTFRWGLGRGGFIEGWPSGHTALTTAVATALASYYDSAWLYLAGLAFSGYVAAGMVAADDSSVHWLSDAVAGFSMGFPIGRSVGTGFRNAGRREEGGLRSWQVVPWTRATAHGLTLVVGWP